MVRRTAEGRGPGAGFAAAASISAATCGKAARGSSRRCSNARDLGPRRLSFDEISAATCRLHSSMPASCSALWLSIAAVLAPLLSIVIFSGVPFHLIALRTNRSAALRSRLAVSRKSTVVPALSTARYRYIHAPLTRT
jgi:hypothetical protein